MIGLYNFRGSLIWTTLYKNNVLKLLTITYKWINHFFGDYLGKTFKPNTN